MARRSESHASIVRYVNAAIAAADIGLALSGSTRARIAISVSRFLISSDLGLFRVLSNRRARRFVQQLAASPEISFDELRLSSRNSPNGNAVVELLERMISDLEKSETDEVIGPMVQLLALHKRRNYKDERRYVLGAARLFRSLRDGDVSDLRRMVTTFPKVTPDDPLVLWDGARLGRDAIPVTIVQSGTEAIEVPTLAHALRLFHLLKQEGLAMSVSRHGDSPSVDATFLPGDDSSLVISRSVANLLALVLE